MASLRLLRQTIAADSETSTALPAGLARALTWLRANLNESVHLDQLAQIADVHPRTLERHFRRFLDTTPHGWVRRLRLVRARQELINGDREKSVTGVALASGFSQLGRFAAQMSRQAPRRLTLEIAGEPAAFDASSLVAAVLRGLLEHDTLERVNLVNAGALAKARGITVVERKTPDAGAFAALLTLSGESGGRTAVVAGTVAAGEPRITRLDDYRLDMAPADTMLITRHMDRPGTVGRVGIMLGEADVNISAMHLARSRPREDALMILALDDDVPESVSDAIRAQEAVLDLWTIRLGSAR